MANWCANTVEVKGEESKVKEFVDGFLNNGISAFYPTPKELVDTEAPVKDDTSKEVEENIKKYGAANWYDWRLENWGTKWDIVDVTELEGNAGYSLMSFETPWSPPIEAFEKLAELFPTLTFLLEYTEPGSGFFGRAMFKDGKLDEDHNYNWEDRFEDGWWLYKELEDAYSHADNELYDIHKNGKITKEEYEKLLKKLEEWDEDKITELLTIIDEEDVEELKKYAKETK